MAKLEERVVRDGWVRFEGKKYFSPALFAFHEKKVQLERINKYYLRAFFEGKEIADNVLCM